VASEDALIIRETLYRGRLADRSLQGSPEKGDDARLRPRKRVLGAALFLDLDARENAFGHFPA
jgi:hypothetical protein